MRQKSNKKPRSIQKPAKREIRVAKQSAAVEAIGKIEKNSDCFILTFGQFSLIDALVAILDQTGPADVVISTWTASDAHLERSAELLESAQIRSIRWIVDRSFESRKPDFCYHMRKIFGSDCIRAIRTHAKFMTIRSETHDIAVRTSMNMNENPRLENIEVSEDRALVEFLESIADEIFAEVKEEENLSQLPLLSGLEESVKFKEVKGRVIRRERLQEPRTTHVVR
jgi:hypothetical protein